MRIDIALVLIISSFLLLGCEPSCFVRSGANEYRAITQTRDSGNSQIVRNFEEYDVDTRINVFLYAMDCRDDPRFEPILARGGQRIIPDIIRRIEQELEVWDKYQLVNVLIRINAECRCIRQNSQEIERLEAIWLKLREDTRFPEREQYKSTYRDKVELLKFQLETDTVN
jgi:hypothetical protein